ncbi:hypothetical protein VKT23_008387 [Stygiomarasmius scandens]|uniref:Myb-like domain-containing protein n=1 Tax=Marasmiellus scandens TaxID=2682957 RepID=A0ABR1JI34_9AGAR
MDNPQYYQPLSHALDPTRSVQYPAPTRAYGSEHTATASNHQPELNEQNESDDDEGMVEEQLARHDSDPASPQPKTSSIPDNPASQPSQPSQPEGETKRRPGRPRGSKNRRGRPSTVQHQTPAKSTYEASSHAPLHSTATGSGTTPPQLSEVNAQNQAYYEFQWRVLSLCAEFYGAAEQLVKATSPLVIAQCYQMGPGTKLDPLVMLTEAKNNCDALLANPSKLIAAPPPPPMYPPAPTPALYAPAQPAAPAATSSTTASSSKPTVINQPQSFVVPMGAPVHYSVYPPPAPYPTASYYQYPYAQPYYAPAPAPTASTSAPVPVATSSPVTTSAPGSQGAWSDEEVERLKKLSADARAAGQTGDAEWDWVANQWGNGRTKRQILAKATQLGLKESGNTRGVKRRRENDGKEDGAVVSGASTAPTPAATSTNVHTNTSSPAQSQATATPAASPSIQNQPRPTASKPPSVSVTPAPVSAMPWPMPTVAASTVSPVLGTPAAGEQRTTSYYRPRPSDSSNKSYLYQTNGRTAQETK